MLTAETARQIFNYDPQTGVISWRNPSANQPNKFRPGNIAGTARRCGRRTINVRGQFILSARLAWLLWTGEWPKNFIDHIDGNPGNDKICNLRDVTPAINQQNVTKPQANNSSGILGVIIDRRNGRFIAAIKKHGLTTYLGRFDTAEEAGLAYQAAKRVLHPEARLCHFNPERIT